MVRLEKTKRDVFMDYDRADKLIQNFKDKRAGLKPRHDLQKPSKKLVVDDPFVPLSYSGIVDP